jgi:hypothetical protein|tara:strand:- start:7653 stop:7973 length:321 start_codon:yes stop_codon:yes gene_type:complete
MNSDLRGGKLLPLVDLEEKQQQTAFANDLEALVERYQSEFDMTFASMAGVLFCFATRTVLDSYMSRVATTVLEDWELVDDDEYEDDEYEDDDDDEGEEWKSSDSGK